jgi:DNA-binding response OmpR family regulator
MNATVGVKSEKGFGSNFFITFPKAKPQKKVIDILIVDDDHQAIDFAEQAIVSEIPEASYMTGRNTKDATNILKNHKFKCILMDAVMPGQSGIEFLSETKFIHQDTKKILVTGEANLELMRDAINKSSIDHMLYKPHSAEELVYLVKKIITTSPIKEEATIDTSNFKPQNWHSNEIPETDNEAIRSHNKNQDSIHKPILVVDDIYDMRELIAVKLENSGYDVITAGDSATALRVLEETIPSLIITDWMMPGISGIDLVSKVKSSEKLKGIPVIMLSAKTDIESKLESHKAGAAAHIGKPFDNMELLSTVHNLLNLKDKEIEIHRQNEYISDNILTKLLPETLVKDLVNGETSFTDKPQPSSITVLKADLSNFTSQTNNLGMLKSSELLTEYIKEMSDAIYSCNGIVESFNGDTITALFGADTDDSAEQQAINAKECANLMHQVLVELNKSWVCKDIPEQSMRIGIHYGQALVGYIGSENRTEFSAVGQTVAMAARIEKNTETDETFVSETIRDLLPENSCILVGDFNILKNDETHRIYKLLKS